MSLVFQTKHGLTTSRNWSVNVSQYHGSCWFHLGQLSNSWNSFSQNVLYINCKQNQTFLSNLLTSIYCNVQYLKQIPRKILRELSRSNSNIRFHFIEFIKSKLEIESCIRDCSMEKSYFRDGRTEHVREDRDRNRSRLSRLVDPRTIVYLLLFIYP